MADAGGRRNGDDGPPNTDPSREDAALLHARDAEVAVEDAPRSGDGEPGARQGTAVVSHRELRMSVGVLTDPRSLAEYEQAVPGAGTTILDHFFAQAKREQEHRHRIESEVIANEARADERSATHADRGQWMALGVAIAGFVLVGYVASLEQPVVAAIIASLDIIGLVSVFIYGRKKQAEQASLELDEPTSPPALPPAPVAPPKRERTKTGAKKKG